MVTPAKVSVYVPCHNYEEYVTDAIDSVLAQTERSFELLVIDDGSSDASWTQITRAVGSDERVRLLRNEKALGLRPAINRAVREARGEFILRLDADDLLHPLALELLIREASQSPTADMVVSDYYYIDDEGGVLGVEQLTIGADAVRNVRASTFPPHSGGALIRSETLRNVGPLAEDIARQDGHELWIRLMRAGAVVRHVPVPLFSYRQHGPSLSSNLGRVLDDRAAVLRRLAESEGARPTVSLILPVRNTYPDMPDVPFFVWRDETLLDQAIRVSRGALRPKDRFFVTTDCERVANHVRATCPDLHVHLRPEDLRTPETTQTEILADLATEAGIPDDELLCVLSVHTPYRTTRHIDKAIDTFLLYECDSVLSVYEERSAMYRMGDLGLRPLNRRRERKIRSEREVIYVDNGAVRVFPKKNLDDDENPVDPIVGHVLMPREASFQIKSPHDLELLARAETP